MRSLRATTRVALPLAALLGLTTLAAAQQSQPDTLPRYVVEGVTVTATRAPARRSELPQKVDVVTTTDIQRTPSDDLAALLKKTAAVDVIQYPGLLSGVGIRGFRPEFSGINTRTLVLIDGRPAGATNLATFDLNAIERVEVLKGPASALYGSNAMGGAINIITRRSGGALRGNASAAYGSAQTTDVNARLGGNLTSRLDTDLSLARFARGADFRIGEGNLLRGLVGSETATKLHADGRTEPVQELGDGQVRANTQYSYRSGSARLGYRLGESLRVDARGEGFRADDVETPGDIFFGTGQDGRKNVGRRTGDISLTGTFGRHTPLLRLFAADEETEFFNTFAAEPFISFVGASDTRGAQLQTVSRFGRQSLTAGLDHTSANAESRRFSAANTPAGTFSPNSGVYSTAAFAQGRFELLDSRLTGTLGGRFDRVVLDLKETPLRPDVLPERETFTTFNPSVGLQYALRPGLRLHGTVGRAFVAPDAFTKAGLSQTVSAAGVASITTGNPDLVAERSLTWDVGVGLERPRLGVDADVTWFRTRVDDRISRVRAAFPASGRPRTAEGTQVGSVTSYVNAAEAQIEGLEWRLGYDFGALTGYRYSLRLFSNATHIFHARELLRAASVDAARFRGRTDFRPEEIVDALVLGSESETQIRNVADLTLSFGAEYDDLKRFSTRLSGRYVGERTDVDFRDFSNISDIRYPAFMVLDLASTVRVGSRYRVGLLVNNLTDENYYEKRGYNLPGRELRLKLSVDL